MIDRLIEPGRVADGQALLAELHDGHLLGWSYGDSTLRLSCRDTAGTSRIVVLTDVSDMFATNVRPANIILCVLAFSSIGSVPAPLVEGLAQSAGPTFVERYVRAAKARETGRPRYLMLQCSYGCDLVVVFDGEIEDERA